MSPLRVMHVIEAMHQGGAESMVVEHIRHAGRDVLSLVVALNRGGPALEAAVAAGARAHVLGKGAKRAAAVRALAALAREERVDVVNGHNPTGALYATAAAKWARVPVIVRTEHSFHFEGRHSFAYPVLEPVATALVHRVVCVCEAVRESHASRFPWAGERFVTVANGISKAPATRDRNVVRAELGLTPGSRAVLAVGSLTTQKAHDQLLEGFAGCVRRIPGARLLIAGEGPLRAPLERELRALGLEGSVTLLGARRDVEDLMAAADLFVLSSVREGLSITLLEAMRAGLAAVATRVGGNPEAVADGETGRLIPARDPAALGAALADLLGDPGLAARMGEAGRARWARHFTAERMVADTEAVYRSEHHRRTPQPSRT